MTKVGNVSMANTSAYQGSGLEKSAPAANTQKSSEPVVHEAPEAAVEAPDKKRPENGLDSVPIEIQEKQNNSESIKRAVEEINRKSKNSEAIFGIHDGTNRVTIKIVDRSTKEILKEFPPEQTLDMIAKVWELAGLLVDEKR